MKKSLLTLFLGSLAAGLAAGAEEETFPFVVSYDAKANAANVSHFLDAPAGKHGFVRVKGGDFVTDAGVIRFNATNLTGPANFPSHEDADKLADRLARLGINCVRHHFMDTWYINFMPRTQGILADDTVTQRKLDPAQLDKFDYLVAALKKRGIYSNLNLHVGRTLDARDGCPNGGPWANKCVGQFMPRMIELQKEYATDLLSHVNPYTGKALKEEPTIAMIEISNEDSLMHSTLRGINLGQPFREELVRQWNGWLKRRYPNREAVADAWRGTFRPAPLGEELVRDGKFDAAGNFTKGGWRTDKGSATATFTNEGGVLKAAVIRAGGQFDPKLFRTVSLEKGKVYTLSLRLRQVSGTAGKLSLAVANVRNGWRELGLREMIPLTGEWQEWTRAFAASETCADAVVQLRFPLGTVELDDLSLRPGATAETLAQNDPARGFETGTVVPIRAGDSPGKRRDWVRFLTDTEAAYWTGMHRHIRDVVGARQPVSGTQLNYSSQIVQAQLDYVDHHAYWRHPGGGSPPGWIHADSKAPWSVKDDAMVNTLGNALALSAQRVKDKPYTISEYNHPPPNRYGAEGQPIMCAFAAFQGWSGVFQYSYNHYPTQFAPVGNPWCLFDSIARAEVLVHFPACSAMLLRGDVKPAKTGAWRAITPAEVVNIQAAGWGIAPGYRASVESLTRAIGVDVAKGAQNVQGGESPSPLAWNRDLKGKAYFTVDAPETKLFTGFPEGRKVKLGAVELEVGKTSLGWATVSLLSRDATGFGERGEASILLAASANGGNADQVVEKAPRGGLTIKDHGKGPVVVEGVPLVLTLPAEAKRVKCWALAPDGERRTEVAVKDAHGQARIEVGPANRTLWYEIQIQR